MEEAYARVKMIDVEHVPVTQQMIMSALKQVTLPDGARVRRVYIDIQLNSVSLEVYSDSYDMVNLNQEIPREKQ